MRTRESFSRWMYNVHNIVNLRTNKPIYKTYEEVRNIYEQYRAKCTDKTKRITEVGCTTPLYRKHKCEIKILPI